ncbi:MAG: single-stranded-DNA-specific exonuclease RecJ [Patescibacteria group bacterium]|nr:single-stranded-DNA-specific exonuclease RecJ [Patescibacteria group bacterium]
MFREWKIAPNISNAKDGKKDYNPIILRLLFNRGVIKAGEIKDFLEPDLEHGLFDPFMFKKMPAAVDLIIKHIKERNKIIVYGDYDADGVTATVVMYEVLDSLKANVDIYIPERVSEGYGLNVEAVKKIQKLGVKLIITVDNGIRNQEEIELAKDLGMDAIITDHHLPPEDGSLPDCLIISSQLADSGYPEKNLAGVGVAFKLASALISQAKLEKNQKDLLVKRLFDLVAIGTVADCVSLLGENRLLVKKGLIALNSTKRLGLKKLIEIAQIKKNDNLDSWNIGFQIGPRINAAGRLAHANTAFQLLITKNLTEATHLAKGLNDRNIERQEITVEIMSKVEKEVNGKEEVIIGVCKKDKAWNEGVVGLVAGKICEKYYRPTLVITKSGKEYKGSGRSIPELNIIKVIEKNKDILERYGGHAAACGFSLKEDKLEEFIDRIKKIIHSQLGHLELKREIMIDSELKLTDINKKLISQIDKLRPFGQGNERPKFVSLRMKIIDIAQVGNTGQHIKLRIKQDNSQVFSAIGFGQAEKWQNLRVDDFIDMVYHLDVNEFNGRSDIQFKIIDIKNKKK